MNDESVRNSFVDDNVVVLLYPLLMMLLCKEVNVENAISSIGANAILHIIDPIFDTTP